MRPDDRCCPERRAATMRRQPYSAGKYPRAINNLGRGGGQKIREGGSIPGEASLEKFLLVFNDLQQDILRQKSSKINGRKRPRAGVEQFSMENRPESARNRCQAGGKPRKAAVFGRQAGRAARRRQESRTRQKGWASCPTFKGPRRATRRRRNGSGRQASAAKKVGVAKRKPLRQMAVRVSALRLPPTRRRSNGKQQAAARGASLRANCPQQRRAAPPTRRRRRPANGGAKLARENAIIGGAGPRKFRDIVHEIPGAKAVSAAHNRPHISMSIRAKRILPTSRGYPLLPCGLAQSALHAATTMARRLNPRARRRTGLVRAAATLRAR
jgi:hypothetical protein